MSSLPSTKRRRDSLSPLAPQDEEEDEDEDEDEGEERVTASRGFEYEYPRDFSSLYEAEMHIRCHLGGEKPEIAKALCAAPRGGNEKEDEKEDQGGNSTQHTHNASGGGKSIVPEPLKKQRLVIRAGNYGRIGTSVFRCAGYRKTECTWRVVIVPKDTDAALPNQTEKEWQVEPKQTQHNLYCPRHTRYSTLWTAFINTRNINDPSSGRALQRAFVEYTQKFKQTAAHDCSGQVQDEAWERIEALCKAIVDAKSELMKPYEKARKLERKRLMEVKEQMRGRRGQEDEEAEQEERSKTEGSRKRVRGGDRGGKKKTSKKMSS